MTAAEPTLAWLLDPLPVQTFFDDAWGARHCHIARGRDDYFDSLVAGPSAAEALLACVGPAPSAVRLVSGDDIKTAEAAGLGDGALDLAGVHDAFAAGYTIVLEGLEHYSRAIAGLSHALEVELNFPTQVNAYLSPPRSAGFTPHYDHHDVLVLQLRGAKTWRLFGDTAMAPQRMQRREPVAAAQLPPPGEVRLDAGDVLYLPRGRIHAAETGAQPSIHLTVGIHTPTALTLLTHALHLLSLRDERIHTRLPPRHLDDAGTRAQLDTVVADIVASVAAPDAIDDGLGAMQDLLVRRGRCPPVAPGTDAAGIDAHTRVAKHQPLYSRVLPVGDRMGLQFAQLLVSAGRDHEAALRFVSGATEPFAVGDLPGLDDTDQVQLARTLVTSGFLIRLPGS